MNARLSALQRRGQTGVVVMAVLTLALFAAMALDDHFLAWCIAPFAAGSFAFTLRMIALIGRLRLQLDREADERAEARKRRERLRQQLRTLAAPDAVDGQCPVCGLDDLGQLAAVDAQLEEPGSRFTRVVPYGARRAHQECAELVPYQMTPVEEHEHDHHGAPIARMIGCPLCAQETREQIANDPDAGRPVWPPLGITCAELSRQLTGLFSVPPADVGPVRGPLVLSGSANYTVLDPECTEREVRAMLDLGLTSADEMRRLGLRPPNEKGNPQ